MIAPRLVIATAAALTLASCGQPAAVSISREGAERAELLAKMAHHPSLKQGPTRSGPDSALLPPPRFPDPNAHHQHAQHGK